MRPSSVIVQRNASLEALVLSLIYYIMPAFTNARAFGTPNSPIPCCVAVVLSPFIFAVVNDLYIL